MSKALTIILLAIMIFGPSIDIYDKSRVKRFSYTGIVYGAVQFIYWIALSITGRTIKTKEESE